MIIVVVVSVLLCAVYTVAVAVCAELTRLASRCPKVFCTRRPSSVDLVVVGGGGRIVVAFPAVIFEAL